MIHEKFLTLLCFKNSCFEYIPSLKVLTIKFYFSNSIVLNHGKLFSMQTRWKNQKTFPSYIFPNCHSTFKKKLFFIFILYFNAQKEKHKKVFPSTVFLVQLLCYYISLKFLVTLQFS